MMACNIISQTLVLTTYVSFLMIRTAMLDRTKFAGGMETAVLRQLGSNFNASLLPPLYDYSVLLHDHPFTKDKVRERRHDYGEEYDIDPSGGGTMEENAAEIVNVRANVEGQLRDLRCALFAKLLVVAQNDEHVKILVNDPMRKHRTCVWVFVAPEHKVLRLEIVDVNIADNNECLSGSAGYVQALDGISRMKLIKAICSMNDAELLYTKSRFLTLKFNRPRGNDKLMRIIIKVAAVEPSNSFANKIDSITPSPTTAAATASQLPLSLTMPRPDTDNLQYQGTLKEICGRPKIFAVKASGSRIVGGKEAVPHSHPWIISIWYNSNQKWKPICGGSILENRWVLTAGHCVCKPSTEKLFKLKNLVVAAGMHYLNNRLGGEKVMKVRQIVVHPKYRSSSLANDIALIETVKEFKFNDNILPICLPAEPVVTTPGRQPSCIVAGWGKTLGTGNNSVLRDLQLPLIPEKLCGHKRVYGKRYNAGKQLCAGFLKRGGKDSCQGDSGGPLTCRHVDHMVLDGVVSWGSGCALKYKPGIYTRTFAYLEFIKSVTGIE